MSRRFFIFQDDTGRRWVHFIRYMVLRMYKGLYKLENYSHNRGYILANSIIGKAKMA